jgi:cytochrome P450
MAAHIWQLSAYDQVVVAAADSARFSCRETNGYRKRSINVLVGTDPPEHTRLRRLASRGLSTRRLESLTPRIRAIVAERVDAFVARGQGDAVFDLAEPLACGVFAHVLGVPLEGLAARRRGRGLRPDPRRAWRRFFQRVIEERREEPRDDLVSTLLEPGPGGDRLSDDELLDFLGLLLTAGIDTTRDLITSLVAELADHPQEWDRLRADRKLLASAVEEGLRFTSPIQAMFRTAARDLQLEGKSVPAGARVMLSFAAANRDERRWNDAGRFDVGRYAGGLTKTNAHVAFGAGPHACPGAGLARLVACCVLGELLDHGVRIERAGHAERTSSRCFRSFLAFPLSVRKE